MVGNFDFGEPITQHDLASGAFYSFKSSYAAAHGDRQIDEKTRVAISRLAVINELAHASFESEKDRMVTRKFKCAIGVKDKEKLLRYLKCTEFVHKSMCDTSIKATTSKMLKDSAADQHHPGLTLVNIIPDTILNEAIATVSAARASISAVSTSNDDDQPVVADVRSAMFYVAAREAKMIQRRVIQKLNGDANFDWLSSLLAISGFLQGLPFEQWPISGRIG